MSVTRISATGSSREDVADGAQRAASVTLETITIVDYDKAGEPPTVSMGLAGDFAIVAGGTTFDVTGTLSLSTDKLELYINTIHLAIANNSVSEDAVVNQAVY